MEEENLKKEDKKVIVLKKRTVLIAMIYLFILIMAITYISIARHTILFPKCTTYEGYHSTLNHYIDTPTHIDRNATLDSKAIYESGFFSLNKTSMVVTSYRELEDNLINKIKFEAEEKAKFIDKLNRDGVTGYGSDPFFEKYNAVIIVFESERQRFYMHSNKVEGNKVTINFGRSIFRGHEAMTLDNYNEIMILPVDKEITEAEINLYEPLPKAPYNACLRYEFAIYIYIYILIMVVIAIKNYNKVVNKKCKKFVAIIKTVISGILIFVGSAIVIYVGYEIYDSTTSTIAKPIIYIYPEEETEVNVKLNNDDKITCIYPEYDSENGWNVLAKPDGNLQDLNTGRNLYALYYESDAIEKAKVEEDGFVVKGEDIAKFLEEKLEILGLNEREAEEFIVYWLPRLEENEYNYIRFETMEEIDNNMILDITPKPDSLIRVIMTYKPLKKPIDIKEQILTSPKREGYTVVEWGATEIER